jgi:hypothetical protein
VSGPLLPHDHDLTDPMPEYRWHLGHRDNGVPLNNRGRVRQEPTTVANAIVKWHTSDDEGRTCETIL